MKTIGTPAVMVVRLPRVKVVTPGVKAPIFVGTLADYRRGK